MKKALKEIFNLKTVLGCYIGAIGYGAGYNIPRTFNVHPIICLICCLALGLLFERLGNKILSTDFYNTSKKNKWTVACFVYIGYLIAWVIVDLALDYDLDRDFLLNFGLIIIIQIILFIIRTFKQYKKDKSM